MQVSIVQAAAGLILGFLCIALARVLARIEASLLHLSPGMGEERLRRGFIVVGAVVIAFGLLRGMGVL